MQGWTIFGNLIDIYFLLLEEQVDDDWRAM